MKQIKPSKLRTASFIILGCLLMAVLVFATTVSAVSVYSNNNSAFDSVKTNINKARIYEFVYINSSNIITLKNNHINNLSTNLYNGSWLSNSTYINKSNATTFNLLYLIGNNTDYYGYRTSLGSPWRFYNATSPYFKSSTNFYNATDNLTTNGLFLSSNNYLYISEDVPSNPVTPFRSNTGINVGSSSSDFKDLKRTLNWTCNGISPNGYNANSSMWGITEDDLGNVYVGEYSVGDEEANCGFIYKTSDNGTTWNMVLNSTELWGGSRHAHNVKFNSYNKCVYASFGDYNLVLPNASRLVRSCDYGNTWITLKNGTGWNIITIEFTPNYNFFGEDKPNSTIYRTSDDINFESVYIFSSQYAWSSTKDNNNTIYFGGVKNADINNNGSIVIASTNEGRNWTIISHRNDTVSYTGFTRLYTLNKQDDVFTYNVSNTEIINIYEMSKPVLYKELTRDLDYTINNENGIYTQLNSWLYNYYQIYYDLYNSTLPFYYLNNTDSLNNYTIYLNEISNTNVYNSTISSPSIITDTDVVVTIQPNKQVYIR